MNATDIPERRLALNQFVGQSLMIPLAMIVGDKLREGSSKMTLAERNQPKKTLLFDRADEAFAEGVGVSRRLHRRRAVRRKRFESPIPAIRYVAASSNESSVVRRGGRTASSFTMIQGSSLARLPRQWTDRIPDDPTVLVGAGRAHFRYDDLFRLVDLLARLTEASRRRR